MRHRGEPERTEPRQLTPIGPVAGAFGYCAAAGMILMGPVFGLWGEIIAVEGIRGGGEDTAVAELRIRISGTGFETFDAACELTAGRPPWAVGDTLDIVVDPADNSFVVVW
jgi:hypothetical protein